jgi:hypothetical protein
MRSLRFRAIKLLFNHCNMILKNVFHAQKLGIPDGCILRGQLTFRDNKLDEFFKQSLSNHNPWNLGLLHKRDQLIHMAFCNFTIFIFGEMTKREIAIRRGLSVVHETSISENKFTLQTLMKGRG